MACIGCKTPSSELAQATLTRRVGGTRSDSSASRSIRPWLSNGKISTCQPSQPNCSAQRRMAACSKAEISSRPGAWLRQIPSKAKLSASVPPEVNTT